MIMKPALGYKGTVGSCSVKGCSSEVNAQLAMAGKGSVLAGDVLFLVPALDVAAV